MFSLLALLALTPAGQPPAPTPPVAISDRVATLEAAVARIQSVQSEHSTKLARVDDGLSRIEALLRDRASSDAKPVAVIAPPTPVTPSTDKRSVEEILSSIDAKIGKLVDARTTTAAPGVAVRVPFPTGGLTPLTYAPGAVPVSTPWPGSSPTDGTYTYAPAAVFGGAINSGGCQNGSCQSSTVRGFGLFRRFR